MDSEEDISESSETADLTIVFWCSMCAALHRNVLVPFSVFHAYGGLRLLEISLFIRTAVGLRTQSARLV